MQKCIQFRYPVILILIYEAKRVLQVSLFGFLRPPFFYVTQFVALPSQIVETVSDFVADNRSYAAVIKSSERRKGFLLEEQRGRNDNDSKTFAKHAYLLWLIFAKKRFLQNSSGKYWREKKKKIIRDNFACQFN